MNKLEKCLRLPIEEKNLLLEAVFFLFFSKILLYIPFRHCVKCIAPTKKMDVQPSVHELVLIRQAVNRANKLAFWKNICLVKSFAARFMLQRRSISSELHLGLQFKNGKELMAHAWLISNDLTITPKGKIDYKTIFTI